MTVDVRTKADISKGNGALAHLLKMGRLLSAKEAAGSGACRGADRFNRSKAASKRRLAAGEFA